jgi:hypothetical protein
VYRAETTVDANGAYVFTGVPRNDQAVMSVETTYAGIRQFSPHVLVSSVEGDTYELPFNIYETTDDPGTISISYMEALVDAVTEEQASLTFQSYEFVNTGDRAYVGQNGRTLILHLPRGAVGPEIDTFGNTPDRFELAQNGDQYTFYDSAPVFPGPADRIAVSYSFAYNGSMQIEQTFEYDIEQLGVYVSETRGLRLESDRLVPIESGELNGITYAGFGSTGRLPAGQLLRYRVYDGPNVARSQATSASEAEGNGSFVSENTTLILGLGILLVVAGGMYLLYDLQKTRLLAQQTGGAQSRRADSASDREQLVAQIAALDEAYEAGELDEAEYQRQREALKEALRRSLG